MIELNKHLFFYPKFFEVISSPDIREPVFAATTLVHFLTKPTPKDLIRAMMLFVENGVLQLELFFKSLDIQIPWILPKR